MTTPAWKSAENGPVNNLNAVNHASQVNQLLDTHAIRPVYEGVQLVTPQGNTNFTWLTYGTATDLDQSFVMPATHTTIGRVTVPIQPIGQGADLMVSLCPDNGSGSPNTSSPLAATSIPASWINNMSAVNGLVSGGPIAASRFNTLYPENSITRVGFAPPGSGITGSAQSASNLRSGNYIVTIGGINNSSTSVPTVLSTLHSGQGVLQLSQPQPSLPVGTFSPGVAATSDTLIVAGGFTGSGAGTNSANVFTASWDPIEGKIGTWSTQTSLPGANSNPTLTTWEENVYVVGGSVGVGSLSIISNVYYSPVVNGQITSWITGPSLPQPLSGPFVAALNNWLIVAGGISDNLGDVTSAVYYAPIKTDGSLGSWQTGPSLPGVLGPFATGSNFDVTDSAVVLVGGGTNSGSSTGIQVLSVTASGLADQWVTTNWSSTAVDVIGLFSLGNGVWDLINLRFHNSYYEYTQLTSVPLVSVPLFANGLTPGSTYHVVLQQRSSSDASSYLNYGLTSAALPNDAKKSSRHSGTWTVAQTGYSVPMAVYDNTPGGEVLHTWEDATSTSDTSTTNLASRTSTLIYNQQNLPYGICESTVLPNDPLNSNPTFTSGTTPWTAHGCTLTQSNVQTHGGFPFSGLITPDGVTSGPYAQSELVPVHPGNAPTGPQYYLASGWMYSPTGYSQVSLSINWFDSSGGFISNTFSGVTVAANTWTFFSNAFTVPTGAAQAALNPTLTGTPTASNLLYLSNVTLTVPLEETQTLPSVNQINYPAGALWPPTGVTQLS